MTVFITSDLHLGHERCAVQFRGFSSVEEHNQTIIDNWNAVVGPHDAVIILGDAVMGKFDDNLPLLGELNGFSYLVAGNHDRFHPSYDKRDWKREEWRQRYNEYVYTLTPLILNYQGFIICHFPYEGDHTEEDRYVEYRPKDDGEHFLLHGHVHSEFKICGRMINVGLDVWGMRPVPVSTLVNIRNESLKLDAR